MRTIRTFILAVSVVTLGIATAGAATEAPAPPVRHWSWQGGWNSIFGSFDRAQLQRGLQVYTEICASCHSLHRLAYRDIGALGYSEDAIKAYAANYEVQDGPNDQGEMYTRPARPSDHFVPPFANEQAARVANNGAAPPDLSLIVKARKGGPNYIYALLTGFEDQPPEGFKLFAGMNYNKYFPDHQIAMPPPLFEGGVEYADGTQATVEQMAMDVTAFLAWASEPELEQRRAMGIGVMVALGILLVMVIAVKRRVWSDVKK